MLNTLMIQHIIYYSCIKIIGKHSKKQLGKKKKCERLEAKKEKEKRKKGPNQTKEAP